MSPESQTQIAAPVPPTPEPAAKRKTRGDIDQRLLDAITLARTCHHEAEKPEHAAPLAEREWTAQDQAALAASVDKCDGLVKDILKARTGATAKTRQESEARTALLAALAPIQKGARRTFADGDPQRGDFGVGQDLANADTETLITLTGAASGQLTGNAPKEKLKGVTTGEIASLSTLADHYRGADFAQGDAQLDASKFLAQLRAEVDTVLDNKRRDLQIAADMAWPHTAPANAPTRRAFGIPEDKATTV